MFRNYKNQFLYRHKLMKLILTVIIRFESTMGERNPITPKK